MSCLELLDQCHIFRLCLGWSDFLCHKALPSPIFRFPLSDSQRYEQMYAREATPKEIGSTVMFAGRWDTDFQVEHARLVCGFEIGACADFEKAVKLWRQVCGQHKTIWD